jgi:adenylate cyclase
MSEVFLSYERSNASQAQTVAEAVRSLGYGVWLDDELPAHRVYANVIEERLNSAKAVVVIWSAEAVKSEWVRSEANRGREDRKLVQLRVDDTKLPMPFDQIQCANLEGWVGDLNSPGWVKVVASLSDLMGGPGGAVRQTPASPIRKNSVCVLPFVNMSGDAEQEYFSDGITEDIITDLSKVSALFVIARNTAFTFKAKNVDVVQVARQLSISHVLEGSVRKAGGRVRITAQLIDGSTGGHVWAERYDRDLTDIFVLQDEISEAIVSALRLKLLPEEREKIERRSTNNLEAYQLYLRARNSLYQNTRSSLDASSKYADRAIKLDQTYSDAWMLLASLAIVEAEDGYLSTRDGYERVRELTYRALLIDPENADAHACLIDVERALNRDWVAAEAQVDVALAIDPTNTNTLNSAALLCITLGRWGDAEGHLQRALARDPLNTFVVANLGNTYYGAGRFEDAERTYRSLIDLAPDFFWTRILLARALLADGRPEAALAELELEPLEEIRLLGLPIALQASGRIAEADIALKSQIATWGDKHPVNVAMVYAYRNDSDAAFRWLERAYEIHDTNLLELVGEHLLKNIADDPRYGALLRKMNLPDKRS